MNGRVAKKIRQYASRHYDRTIDEILEKQSNMFKPKPRWMPMMIWVWVLGFFVKIKSNGKKEGKAVKNMPVFRAVPAQGAQVEKGKEDKELGVRS
jgi:hypothetical protein